MFDPPPRSPFDPDAGPSTPPQDASVLLDPAAQDPGVLPPPQAPAHDGRRPLGWRGVLAAVVAGMVGAALVVLPVLLLGGGQSPADADRAPISAIARDVSPSVARVDAQTSQGVGTGSAVIYNDEGILITNAHVVGDAATVSITLPDGARHEAEVLGRDARSDLAVLEVADTDLAAPQWADRPGDEEETSPVMVGDPVVAIGSPFGLDGTVTSGIISAVGRTVPAGGPPGQGATLVDLLQTDAAINPGNSGGALTDAAGRIIGVNTAIVSRGGGNEGVGFAIPASTVHNVAEQLLETGEVQHAELGIVGQTINADIARQYGLDVEAGAVIAEVRPDGPAAQAGLQPGDIVVTFNGARVESVVDLVGRIQQRRPGDVVELDVVRAGERLTVFATLAERQ